MTMIDDVYVEVMMRRGSAEVQFVEVWPDGHRKTYWLGFWRACWHVFRLNMTGITVIDRIED
jgi:hypothetical protein